VTRFELADASSIGDEYFEALSALEKRNHL
jgi:hypothetical protein